MAPDKHKILIDHLDKVLEEGRSPESLHPFPGDPEAPKEWRLLTLALEAIRFHGLVRDVREVGKRFKEENHAQFMPPATDHAPAFDATPAPLFAVVPPSDETEVATAETETESKEEETPVIPFARRFVLGSMKVAAGVALLICLAGIAKYLMTTPYGIYEKYYTSYDLGTTRGSDASGDIENAYRVRNWPGVEQAFTTLPQKSNEDYFLMGMAFMEQTRYYEAMGMFRDIMKNSDTTQAPYFQDEAQYYLALCYLAVGQTEPGREILEKIRADKNNAYNKQVTKMSLLDRWILKTK